MALSRGFVSDLCPGDTTLDYAEREMKEEKKKREKANLEPTVSTAIFGEFVT